MLRSMFALDRNSAGKAGEAHVEYDPQSLAALYALQTVGIVRNNDLTVSEANVVNQIRQNLSTFYGKPIAVIQR